MSKKLSKKIVALLVVVAASMVAMAFLLYNMQSQLTRNSYIEEMQLEAEELAGAGAMPDPALTATEA